MTTVTAIAITVGLLAAARWALTVHRTAHRVYPPRGRSSSETSADAERALELSGDLGASTGHLWAWRDLLSDTAEEASRVSAGGGESADPADRRRAFDEAASRIRSALTDLDTRDSSAPARHGSTPEGAGPWSG